MSSYEPGDRLRNPDTDATFRVLAWTHAVILRNERTGNTTAIPAAITDRFERIDPLECPYDGFGADAVDAARVGE